MTLGVTSRYLSDIGHSVAVHLTADLQLLAVQQDHHHTARDGRLLRDRGSGRGQAGVRPLRGRVSVGSHGLDGNITSK